MRKWKKLLAAALSVTLLTSLMAAPSYAEETQKKGWVLEDDGWHFYKMSDGKMVKGKEKYVQGKFYAFDDDGVMYEDNLFTAPESVVDQNNPDRPNRYAFPDGHLAESTWVKLNKDERLYTADDAENNEAIYWYYFGKGDSSEEKQTGGPMFFGDDSKLDQDKKIDGIYRFHDNGVMYSGEWYGYDEDGTQPDSNAAYYQVNGDRAINKCLYMNDTWYHFDDKGSVNWIWNKEIGETATGSDAKPPYPEVLSVESMEEDEVVVPLGETVELKFKVNMATDSNAEHDTFTKSSHDIWATLTLLGKYKIKVKEEDKKNGICTLEYTPKVVGEEKVSLFVDTKDMYSEPITVKATLDNLKDKNVEAKKDVVISLMDTLLDDTSIKANVTETLGSIKKIIVDTEGTDKKTLQEEIVNHDNYSKLENVYIMENNITVNVDSSKVLSVLGENGISMVGGALNATERNETVTLQVDSTEIPSGLKAGNADTNVSAFDITMIIGANSVGELELPVKITMTVPAGFDATKEITLYHYHGDEEPTKETLIPKDGKVEFVVDKFSTFAFAQKKEEVKPNPNPSTSDDDDDDFSSSSRNNNSGQWILDSKGWWYKNSNGSYPANTWSYLEYNHVKDWYRFDQNGYMMTGWFTDADGLRYYMNPVSNGFRGAMQTGWQLIDGQWYYFNTTSDGHKGMLYVNTVTPDGYHVNESGQIVD